MSNSAIQDILKPKTKGKVNISGPGSAKLGILFIIEFCLNIGGCLLLIFSMYIWLQWAPLRHVVPDQRLNQHPLKWEHGVLTTGSPGKLLP